MSNSSQPIEIPNRFDFVGASDRIYLEWIEAGCFDADVDPKKKPFTIVIPPPNVTGALHLGHALNNTLQDIQIRMHRMMGEVALWMPGTDHAGIATQAVVEKRLKELENKTRHDLGRDALIQRIWDWKEQYEGRILSQLKRLGCSCDWRRTRFTLDPMCARAVRRTFYDLFSKGLIYRGKRLVNWDTYLQTAVSDDEVTTETVEGNFWHFRYPVIDPKPGEPSFVVVATTRPETMLGDTAVAVHPDPAGDCPSRAKARRSDRERQRVDRLANRSS
jgi:valyl-tRNA synthetase